MNDILHWDLPNPFSPEWALHASASASVQTLNWDTAWETKKNCLNKTIEIRVSYTVTYLFSCIKSLVDCSLSLRKSQLAGIFTSYRADRNQSHFPAQRSFQAKARHYQVEVEGKWSWYDKSLAKLFCDHNDDESRLRWILLSVPKV